MIWGPCPAQSPGTFVCSLSKPRMAPFHQRGRLCSLVPLGMNTLGPCPSSKASLAGGTKPEVTDRQLFGLQTSPRYDIPVVVMEMAAQRRDWG